MIYLLDVNVLLAASYDSHCLHERAKQWLDSLPENEAHALLATCSVTELGFVRIACCASGLARNLYEAQHGLTCFKKQRHAIFLHDSVEANCLPTWVTKSKHVTDGHLVGVAAAHNGTLATLDEGIPGAFIIPKTSFVKERWTRYGMAA